MDSKGVMKEEEDENTLCLQLGFHKVDIQAIRPNVAIILLLQLLALYVYRMRPVFPLLHSSSFYKNRFYYILLAFFIFFLYLNLSSLLLHWYPICSALVRVEINVRSAENIWGEKKWGSSKRAAVYSSSSSSISFRPPLTDCFNYAACLPACLGQESPNS
jgi:hypothetical protein